MTTRRTRSGVWAMGAVVAATLSVAAATLGAQQAHGTQVGRVTAAGSPTAPSYVLTDQDGRRVDSAAFRGKVQVVRSCSPSARRTARPPPGR